MKRLAPYIGLSVMLLFASCEKDIEFEGEITEPLMVVTSITTPDSLLTVRVTESRFFLSSQDTFTVVTDANVSLFINGTFREQMTFDTSDGLYKGTYKTTARDLIRLVITASGLPATESEFEVPSHIQLTGTDTSILDYYSYPIENYLWDEINNTYIIDTVGYYYAYTVDATLKFMEPASETNYYRLVIKKRTSYNDTAYTDSYLWYEKTDLVFGEDDDISNEIIDVSTYNSYGIFSDELINGKEYPLTFSFSVYNEVYSNENDTTDTSGSALYDYYLDLQMLSQSYYLYLLTYTNSGFDLFSEPTQIHSNIDGGIGIAGSYTSNSIKLDSTH